MVYYTLQLIEQATVTYSCKFEIQTQNITFNVFPEFTHLSCLTYNSVKQSSLCETKCALFCGYLMVLRVFKLYNTEW